jgi:hypothetical protein
VDGAEGGVAKKLFMADRYEVILATPWAPRQRPDWDNDMPSLFRFLFVLSSLGAVILSGLYVLATRYEPEQQMFSKPVQNVKIRRDSQAP